MATNATLSRWLKQHAAGEKILTKLLRRYFTDQGKRLLSRLREMGVASPDLVAKVFSIDDEHAKLMAAISDPLIGFMATGAEDILARAKQQKSTKAFDFKNFELPAWVKSEIEVAFIDLEKQTYWRDIQKTTLFSVTDAITVGLEAGLSADGMADSLQELFKGFSDFRAMAIARTETTGAYNRGHQASYDYLHQSGMLAEKEWLSIIDSDTRATHAEADGQKVAVNDSFTVGGESAPFPGHPSLSAKNRVHCRCTTAGVFE